MAIKYYASNTRSVDGEMTVDEFKQWLSRFDANGDGRISKDELRMAIRSLGLRFSSWKSSHLIRKADSDGNGYIDDSEIDNLVDFAQKTLGLKIVAY